MSGNTFKCLVFYAMPYSITDERTGAINQGISVQYILGDNLTPTADANSGSKGISVSKCSFPVSCADSIGALPAVYEVDFTIKNVSGKPTLTPQSLKFLHEVSLTPVDITKK